MSKRRTPTIPNKCPICAAVFQFGKPNREAEGGEVLEVTYACGGRVTLYRFPEGWRLDICNCKKQPTHQQKIMEGNQKSLFIEQQQGD